MRWVVRSSHFGWLFGLGALVAACSPRVAPLPAAPAATAAPIVLTDVAPSSAEPARRSVRLVVLGSFPSELREVVARTLAETWQLRVEQGERIALPRAAYYPPRKRYRADRLTDYLGDLLAANREGRFILGLTEVDVSATKGRIHDWGMFGLARIGGPGGVLSTHRLAPSAKSAEQLRHRVAVVAAHEVGHMFGMQHCDEQGCIMRDAEGAIRHVDDSDGGLGPRCRALLRKR